MKEDKICRPIEGGYICELDVKEEAPLCTGSGGKTIEEVIKEKARSVLREAGLLEGKGEADLVFPVVGLSQFLCEGIPSGIYWYDFEVLNKNGKLIYKGNVHGEAYCRGNIGGIRNMVIALRKVRSL